MLFLLHPFNIHKDLVLVFMCTITIFSSYIISRNAFVLFLRTLRSFKVSLIIDKTLSSFDLLALCSYSIIVIVFLRLATLQYTYSIIIYNIYIYNIYFSPCIKRVLYY